MFDSVVLSQIVDGAFVCLVLFLTWRSFSAVQPQGVAPEKSEKWHAELRSLADTLRDLISDASAASMSLDRNLLKRREELERVLAQAEVAQDALERTIEEAEQEVAAPPRQQSRKRAPAVRNLPNSSWREAEERKPAPAARKAAVRNAVKKAQATPPAAPKRRAVPKAAPKALPELELEDSLSDLVELQDDTVELSFRGSEPRQALASDIEISGEEEEAAVDASALSSLNPTAVRVAERLLNTGQEIHVVARKLELPVAVVRAIDGAMRRQTKPDPRKDNREVVAKGIFPRPKEGTGQQRHAPLFEKPKVSRRQVTL